MEVPVAYEFTLKEQFAPGSPVQFTRELWARTWERAYFAAQIGVSEREVQEATQP